MTKIFLATSSGSLHLLRLTGAVAVTVLLCFLPQGAEGFMFNDFSAFPQLQDLAKAQTDCNLKIQLEIGGANHHRGSRMGNPPPPALFLDGLELNLLQDMAAKGSHVGLPGANGPHPQTSSGAKVVKVVKAPSFIGMNGMERVKLDRGGWEMVWRKNSPAGSLICGFDVPKEAIRNNVSAKLPSGCLYVSFPIWTPEGLAEQQVRKADAERRASEHDQEKNDKLAAMNQEGNVIKKLFLYRDAAEAYEKSEMTGLRFYQYIPSSEGILEVQDGLLVGLTGSVWTVSKDLFQTKTLIGGAKIKVDPKPESEILRP